MRDIAIALELSTSTVARALADSPQISEQTKARVRMSAAELGYVVHSAARAMRRGHSTLVGLIIPDVQNEFYGTLAKGLAQCCEKAGFQLLLAITEDDPDSEERHVRGLSEARAAGIVIVPSPRPHKETLALLARGPWVQLIRRIAAARAPWFGIDEEAALRTATAHLLSLGHRRIGYIGGMLDLSTGERRLAGYRAAFGAGGLAAPEQLVRTGAPRMHFAAEAFEELWRLPERPTAIVTAGARLTAGALERIGQLGLKLPADLSFVGYGDAPWWSSNLSTVGLPVREVAMACGEFLLRRVREKPSSAEDGQLAYEAVHAPTLILRSSTAPVTDTARNIDSIGTLVAVEGSGLPSHARKS
ncbi:MAG: LacI family DNA-binding transcriptional regulator [Proteobacteria bacterium]|nr:LacI family DNA-binding transcriptional regulator [Pseudomonadota bacterium]